MLSPKQILQGKRITLVKAEKRWRDTNTFSKLKSKYDKKYVNEN